ncbi:MAG: FAD-binding oxidoreductase [Gammaproteobacteria bacterium]|nr:FAD-binding oxidoreductase [Gammaproteobacteria bacterium]
MRIALLLMSVLLSSCTVSPTLKDFTSDGCSLFPNGTARDPKLWCECCYQHDLAYWRGGTDIERLQADEQLRQCVTSKTGDAALAETMFLGVRSGGAPLFPTGYRWGYGWNYGRGYAPLSSSEQAQVDDGLAAMQKRQRHFSCE